VTAGAGRAREALTFGDISSIRVKGPQIVDVPSHNGSVLGCGACGISSNRDACNEPARH
jgi:hypothetical protein